MNVKMNKNVLSRFLCFVLIAVMALSAAGCGTTNPPAPAATEAPAAATEAPVEATEAPVEEVSEPVAEASDAAPATDVYTEDTELGEGSKTITFVATAAEDNAVTFTIHTDAATVGEALLSLKLIAGEESSYGLYVKTVNGVTADYDKDGTYWAFYIDGEYAMTGVDATEITDGAVYAFTITKG